MKKPTGTSMIFINGRKEVLLLLRDNISQIRYPGCWDLVGGKAEAGESAKEAIVREVKEETGIKIENPKLFWVTDFDDRVEHTFWQKTNLKISEIALQEGQRLEWFSEGRIRKTPEEKIGFNFKPIILDFFEKKPW